MERAITVLSDIKDLSELLDGARIDQVRLVPDGGRLRVEMELTRACPELKTTVRVGLRRRVKVPWVKSRLSLAHIKDASVQRLEDGPADQTPLLSCEAVSGGYACDVTGLDGLQLSLSLEQLSGEFADTSSPADAP